MTDLNPCPFCGERLHLSEPLSTRSVKYFVHEPNGCIVQSTTVSVSERDSSRLDAWNRRSLTAPQLHQLGGGVETVIAALEKLKVQYSPPFGMSINEATRKAAQQLVRAALAQQPLSVLFSDAGTAWVNARSAMINMPMNSPDYRAKLNALSEAENNLVAAIRAHPTQSDVSCSRAREGGTE